MKAASRSSLAAETIHEPSCLDYRRLALRERAVPENEMAETGDDRPPTGLPLFQSLVDRGLSHRRHELESRCIRMQPVIRELFLEQPLIVDHGGKVVEVDDVVFGTIILEPFVQ